MTPTNLITPQNRWRSLPEVIAFDSSLPFTDRLCLRALPPESQTDEYLAFLQSQIRLLQKRMKGMEPVNMLALEAYEETNNRLQELSDKLATLEAESMELLLRIENFITLRFQAFSEAFDAVNANFQNIFAELSDGDGFLQLENPEDPFAGGLNLVAHPKGKPVQRSSSKR